MSGFKGFAGAEKKPALSNLEQLTAFTCGLVALQSENLTEAYLCFTKLPGCCEALFNLSLCYYKAGLYPKALITLEQAQETLARSTTPMPQTPAIPTELMECDANSYSYQAPVAWQAASLLPSQIRQRILRLMADIYGKLGFQEEFLRILPLMKGRAYINIIALKQQLGENLYDN